MVKAVRTTEKSRLSAEDWEQATLDVIGSQGLSAVAVESLARDLGVTKGSFYWHFENRDALIIAALDRWEAEDTRTFERSIGIIKDPREKLRTLFRRTRKEIRSHLIFRSLFNNADHRLVAPVMQRVSERRIEYLFDGFRNLGLGLEDALNRARLTYLSYVGFLQYYQAFRSARMSAEELDSYVNHVIAALIP